MFPSQGKIRWSNCLVGLKVYGQSYQFCGILKITLRCPISEKYKTKNLVLWPLKYKNQLHHLVKKINLVTEIAFHIFHHNLKLFFFPQLQLAGCITYKYNNFLEIRHACTSLIRIMTYNQNFSVFDSLLWKLWNCKYTSKFFEAIEISNGIIFYTFFCCQKKRRAGPPDG